MRQTCTMVGLALLLASAAPAAAQQDGIGGQLSVFAHTGSLSALSALNRTSTSRLDAGLAFGGGVEWAVNDYLGLRATVLRAENDVQHGSRSAGWQVNRTFVGGELQARIPTGTRMLPYLVAGGGVVSVDPDDGESHTRAQLGGGIGVRLGLGQGRLGVFTESRFLHHSQHVETTSLGHFPRAQIGFLLTAGLSAHLR